MAAATAPSSAPEAAPPRALTQDEVFLVIEDGGVVRHADGTFEVFYRGTSPVRDIALDSAGSVFVATRTDVHVVRDGVVVDLPAPPGGQIPTALAVTDRGLVGASPSGYSELKGERWEETTMVEILGDEEGFGRQLSDVAALGSGGAMLMWPNGVLVARPPSAVARDHVPGREDETFAAIASGADGTLALLQGHHVYRRSPGLEWTHFARPLGDSAMRSIHVSSDGTVTAAALGPIVIIPPDGEPEAFELPVAAAWIHAVARDSEGNTWVATDHSLVVVSPTLLVLQQWEVGSVPELDHHVSQIHVR